MESGASDPSYRKHVSAAQQKMTPYSKVYSKTFKKCLFGRFCQRLGADGKSKNWLYLNTGSIKDDSSPRTVNNLITESET